MREKLFEPYATSKQRGSGLGLSVCKRIAEEHGATVDLAPPSVLPTENPPPATVFRVRFPAEAQSVAARRKRLLVVDDEGIIRSIFKDLMGKECEVAEAETAEEALAQLRSSGTKFDLILTDKNLPGLSGLELAQEARRLDPTSRVMVMTGYPSLVTAQQALELGVVDYLLKPFDDIRQVRDKIRQVLAASAPGKAATANKRIDVYEDNEPSARAVSEALRQLGLEPHILREPVPGGDDAPLGVVVSWDFGPAPGRAAVELGKAVARGAPFVVLVEHLSMETTLEALRAGCAACLPKLLSDTKALSRELSRALKVG
jgi:DNA-binding NtrC family response regulator